MNLKSLVSILLFACLSMGYYVSSYGQAKTARKASSVNEQKFASLYFGIPYVNCVDNNGKPIIPHDWTVKFVNDNGTTKVFRNLQPHHKATEDLPSPESALQKDLRDLYYIEIPVPASLAGDNQVYISTSLFDFKTKYEAVKGGITLTTHTPGNQISLYLAIENTTVPETGKKFNAKKCDIKVTNESGKTLDLPNVLIVGPDSPRRAKLSDDQRKSLSGFVYSNIVLPASFEGNNEITITTPEGTWKKTSKDNESNTTITHFFYMGGRKK